MKKKILGILIVFTVLFFNIGNVSAAKVLKCNYTIRQWYGLGDYHYYKVSVTDKNGKPKVSYSYSKDDKAFYGKEVPDVEKKAISITNADFYNDKGFKCPKLFKCNIQGGKSYHTNITAAQSDGGCTNVDVTVQPKISREKTANEKDEEAQTVKRYSTISCGEGMEIPKAVPKFVSSVFQIAKYLVPVALIFLGMLDFAKAVISSDEQVTKNVVRKFIRRIIGAVAIFFVIALVQFIFGMVKTDYKPLSCISCFISGNC